MGAENTQGRLAGADPDGKKSVGRVDLTAVKVD
jgi:hypothetical protein